ncbi:hypothetical protein ECANGB1_2639 [Enterospora canceri]|uniref:Secreted protein n=1 Tax=Enterospora canceri TaxID=1081671 RepID=A0A1Y1S8P4_9MICR|nr:hypothetical protein ECANGB1_2639 [Enterospora canceri]
MIFCASSLVLFVCSAVISSSSFSDMKNANLFVLNKSGTNCLCFIIKFNTESAVEYVLLQCIACTRIR